jgi:hypothetical protein
MVDGTTRVRFSSRAVPTLRSNGLKPTRKGVNSEVGGEMNSVLHPPTVPRWVTVISSALSLLGLVGLVLTCVLAFETPNMALFSLSGALTFAVPLALLWHFAATRALTTAEKRVWIRELTGPAVWSAISEYITSPDLRASARTRADEAAARRTVRNHT